MRKDIAIENIVEGGCMKLNKTELAKKYNCCWETIDRKLNPDKYRKDKKTRIYASILDPFKELINTKLENNNVPATGIYFLLKRNYNYKGKYGIVRKYVSSFKNSMTNELTIRFETVCGYQSQVDWKEKLKLHDKKGNIYEFNIFLIVLGFSRMKYIELTFDKTKPTLYSCLTNAFEYFGGTTEEILFDNMKTVVNHTLSSFNNVIINQETDQFSKDANFKIITCRPYRARTKGKVETLAKIMNRLRAFDYEFDNANDLDNVVIDLNYELNYIEKSQATEEIPNIRFLKEKEHLTPINTELLTTYFDKPIKYKVSNESMIKYEGIKYSVPVRYIGHDINILDDDESIHLYYNKNLLCSYTKNSKYRFNYKKDDYINILKNSSFDKKTSVEIEEYINKNMKSLDGINVEGVKK